MPFEVQVPMRSNSPPLEPRDGTVRLPWLAILFEGRYVLKVWSMDANWFDLARTDPALGAGGAGFGGQAGDSFERPIFDLPRARRYRPVRFGRGRLGRDLRAPAAVEARVRHDWLS